MFILYWILILRGKTLSGDRKKPIICNSHSYIILNGIVSLQSCKPYAYTVRVKSIAH